MDTVHLGEAWVDKHWPSHSLSSISYRVLQPNVDIAQPMVRIGMLGLTPGTFFSHALVHA